MDPESNERYVGKGEEEEGEAGCHMHAVGLALSLKGFSSPVQRVFAHAGMIGI